MAKLSSVTEIIIEVLVAALIFGALFPQATNAVNAMGLDNVTIFGTAYDWSFAGYLLLLAIVLVVVFGAVAYIRKK